MNKVWANLHDNYKDRDWIDKPSLFAETAITYFPATGNVLELGAGQGQDSRYFASHGYEVVSTDLEPTALERNQAKLNDEQKSRVQVRSVDVREELPFEADSFDIVYAHLSLHYFNYDTTERLFDEIERVLKTGGILAFFVNSTDDPQYGTGEQLEVDYYKLGDMAKRFFNVASLRTFVRYFDTALLDNHGETYKDSAKGVHNLIRYIGYKAERETFKMCVPYCGAIIERENNGETELLMQIRWKPQADPTYSGTLEFAAGKLDAPYEDVHLTLAHEIKEETGLTLKSIRNDVRTAVLDTGRDDKIIGFRPFCCTQQLKGTQPWIGFVFICEVEPGEPTAQLSESKEVRWMKATEVKELVVSSPDKLFGLELPAWHYYFAIDQG